MSEARRVQVEIRIDAETRERVGVGARTLYHFWPLLQAHYRGVLLPPQRRPDGDKVAWHWAQAEPAHAPSSEELKKLRTRLSDAHRSLVDAWSRGIPGSSLTAEEAEVARSRLGRMIANLVSLPERELLGYVALTTEGLAVHSWGAVNPGAPTFPDEQVLSIRGRVRKGDAPVVGTVIDLEDEDGRTLDHARADTSGSYGFYKLKPGRYRLKARSPRATFAPEGIPVDLEGGPAEGIDLVAEEPAEKVDVLEDGPTRQRRQVVTEKKGLGARRAVLALLAFFALVGGGLYWWLSRETPAPRRPVGGAPNVASSGPQVRPEPDATPTPRRSRAETEEVSTTRATPRGAPLALDDDSLYAAFERPDARAAPGTEGGAVDERSGETTSGQPADLSGTLPDAQKAGAKPKSAASPPPGAQSPAGSGPAAIKPGARVRPVEAVLPDGATPGGASPTGNPKATPRTRPGGTPEPSPAGVTPPPAPSPEPAERPTEGGAATAKSGSAGKPAKKTSAATAARATAGGTAAGVAAGADSPVQEEGPAAEASEEPSAASSAGLRPTPTPEPERWQTPLRLELGRWRVRLFADAIVPTEPRPLGEASEDWREARERTLRWRQERQPDWLRQPRLTTGLQWSVPSSEVLRWESASGQVTAVEEQAELSWTGGFPTRTDSWQLRDERGRVWVRVRQTLAGEVAVQAREGVRTAWWVQIGGVAQLDPSWRWATDRGWALPSSWSVEEPRVRGVHRLRVPLEPGAETRGQRWSIRWMDTDTAWGIGAEVTFGEEASSVGDRVE